LALIFFSGGESGTPDFTSYTSNIVCSTTYKKTGNYSFRFFGTGYDAIQSFGAMTEFYIVASFYFTAWASNAVLLNFRSSSTSIVSLRSVSIDNRFSVYVGGSNVASSSGIFWPSVNTWIMLELHVKIGSSGLIHLRANGLDDIIYSGATNTSGLSVDNLQIAGANWNGYIDDLIINDTTGSINNSWMGGAKVVALSPVGPGSSSQWTPSAGLNWQCVDEIPISATDYVTGNIAGLLDLYDLASLPAGVCSNVSMLGVKVFNSIARSGITISYIKNSLRTNSSTVSSPNVSVPADALMQGYVWELNPVTGTTWTYTDIDALEAGVKVA
jgi:hypothetical protein